MFNRSKFGVNLVPKSIRQAVLEPCNGFTRRVGNKNQGCK